MFWARFSWFFTNFSCKKCFPETHLQWKRGNKENRFRKGAAHGSILVPFWKPRGHNFHTFSEKSAFPKHTYNENRLVFAFCIILLIPGRWKSSSRPHGSTIFKKSFLWLKAQKKCKKWDKMIAQRLQNWRPKCKKCHVGKHLKTIIKKEWPTTAPRSY